MITLYNPLEGLTIDVGYAGNEGMRANALAIGISIQDLPEGFVVATALLAVGYSRGFSILLGISSSLVEPLGAVAGAAIIGSSALLPSGARASPPAPCSSSSATKSSQNRTARGHEFLRLRG